MADARSNIAIRVIKIYEGKGVIQEKDHVVMCGAAGTTTLCFTGDIHRTGRIVTADSWIESVKTVISLKECGLYSAMLVKRANRQFPIKAPDSHVLLVGEWVAYTANLDGVELQAVNFQDLEKKQSISTYSTILPCNSRKTKYYGDTSCPKNFELYLTYTTSISIHNHVRTGSIGFYKT